MPALQQTDSASAEPLGPLSDVDEPAAADVLLRAFSPVAPAEVDERAARRSLREQIVRLESELCRVATGDDPIAAPRVSRHRSRAGDPQVLDLGGLERVRDDLADRLRLARGDQAALAALHAANRRRVEAMMGNPAAHRFESVSYEDVGERRCGGWEVRPRLGPVGLLMGWWRVKISSGCPLAGRP